MKHNYRINITYGIDQKARAFSCSINIQYLGQVIAEGKGFSSIKDSDVRDIIDL